MKVEQIINENFIAINGDDANEGMKAVQNLLTEKAKFDKQNTDSLKKKIILVEYKEKNTLLCDAIQKGFEVVTKKMGVDELINQIQELRKKENELKEILEVFDLVQIVSEVSNLYDFMKVAKVESSLPRFDKDALPTFQEIATLISQSIGKANFKFLHSKDLDFNKAMAFDENLAKKVILEFTLDKSNFLKLSFDGGMEIVDASGKKIGDVKGSGNFTCNKILEKLFPKSGDGQLAKGLNKLLGKFITIKKNDVADVVVADVVDVVINETQTDDDVADDETE